MECKACGKAFKTRHKIDGQIKILSSRKYCLDCSPFGSFNRKKLELKNIVPTQKYCEKCNEILPDYMGNRKTCGGCNFRERREKLSDKVHAIVGDACWYCGYDKGRLGRKMLDFHHMDRKQKTMYLSIREIASASWAKIIQELPKCCLLCCRCHREVEYGVIEEKDIQAIYKERWKQIGLVTDWNVPPS